LIRNAIRTPKLPIATTSFADDSYEACTLCCNFSQLLMQCVSPRQNAGGLPQRMRDGACASEANQPHGKRHGQAAAGK